MRPNTTRRADFLSPRFLASLLIAGQLGWGLPPLAADTLRPSVEGTQAGLEQVLQAAGQEEAELVSSRELELRKFTRIDRGTTEPTNFEITSARGWFEAEIRKPAAEADFQTALSQWNPELVYYPHETSRCCFGHAIRWGFNYLHAPSGRRIELGQDEVVSFGLLTESDKETIKARHVSAVRESNDRIPYLQGTLAILREHQKELGSSEELRSEEDQRKLAALAKIASTEGWYGRIGVLDQMILHEGRAIVLTPADLERYMAVAGQMALAGQIRLERSRILPTELQRLRREIAAAVRQAQSGDPSLWDKIAARYSLLVENLSAYSIKVVTFLRFAALLQGQRSAGAKAPQEIRRWGFFGSGPSIERRVLNPISGPLLAAGIALSGGTFYDFDFSQAMLDQGRKALEQMGQMGGHHQFRIDIVSQGIPLADVSLDVAETGLMGTIGEGQNAEGVSKKIHILLELNRVLDQGGYLILTVKNKPLPKPFQEALGEYFGFKILTGSAEELGYGEEMLKQIARGDPEKMEKLKSHLQGASYVVAVKERAVSREEVLEQQGAIEGMLEYDDSYEAQRRRGWTQSEETQPGTVDLSDLDYSRISVQQMVPPAPAPITAVPKEAILERFPDLGLAVDKLERFLPILSRRVVARRGPLQDEVERLILLWKDPQEDTFEPSDVQWLEAVYQQELSTRLANGTTYPAARVREAFPNLSYEVGLLAPFIPWGNQGRYEEETLREVLAQNRPISLGQLEGHFERYERYMGMPFSQADAQYRARYAPEPSHPMIPTTLHGHLLVCCAYAQTPSERARAVGYLDRLPGPQGFTPKDLSLIHQDFVEAVRRDAAWEARQAPKGTESRIWSLRNLVHEARERLQSGDPRNVSKSGVSHEIGGASIAAQYRLKIGWEGVLVVAGLSAEEVTTISHTVRSEAARRVAQQMGKFVWSRQVIVDLIQSRRQQRSPLDMGALYSEGLGDYYQAALRFFPQEGWDGALGLAGIPAAEIEEIHRQARSRAGIRAGLARWGRTWAKEAIENMVRERYRERKSLVPNALREDGVFAAVESSLRFWSGWEVALSEILGLPLPVIEQILAGQSLKAHQLREQVKGNLVWPRKRVIRLVQSIFRGGGPLTRSSFTEGHYSRFQGAVVAAERYWGDWATEALPKILAPLGVSPEDVAQLLARQVSESYRDRLRKMAAAQGKPTWPGDRLSSFMLDRWNSDESVAESVMRRDFPGAFHAAIQRWGGWTSALVSVTGQTADDVERRIQADRQKAAQTVQQRRHASRQLRQKQREAEVEAFVLRQFESNAGLLSADARRANQGKLLSAVAQSARWVDWEQAVADILGRMRGLSEGKVRELLEGQRVEALRAGLARRETRRQADKPTGPAREGAGMEETISLAEALDRIQRHLHEDEIDELVRIGQGARLMVRVREGSIQLPEGWAPDLRTFLEEIADGGMLNYRYEEGARRVTLAPPPSGARMPADYWEHTRVPKPPAQVKRLTVPQAKFLLNELLGWGTGAIDYISPSKSGLASAEVGLPLALLYEVFVDSEERRVKGRSKVWPPMRESWELLPEGPEDFYLVYPDGHMAFAEISSAIGEVREELERLKRQAQPAIPEEFLAAGMEEKEWPSVLVVRPVMQFPRLSADPEAEALLTLPFSKDLYQAALDWLDTHEFHMPRAAQLFNHLLGKGNNQGRTPAGKMRMDRTQLVVPFQQVERQTQSSRVPIFELPPEVRPSVVDLLAIYLLTLQLPPERAQEILIPARWSLRRLHVTARRARNELPHLREDLRWNGFLDRIGQIPRSTQRILAGEPVLVVQADEISAEGRAAVEQMAGNLPADATEDLRTFLAGYMERRLRLERDRLQEPEVPLPPGWDLRRAAQVAERWRPALERIASGDEILQVTLRQMDRLTGLQPEPVLSDTEQKTVRAYLRRITHSSRGIQLPTPEQVAEERGDVNAATVASHLREIRGRFAGHGRAVVYLPVASRREFSQMLEESVQAYSRDHRPEVRIAVSPGPLYQIYVVFQRLSGAERRRPVSWEDLGREAGKISPQEAQVRFEALDRLFRYIGIPLVEAWDSNSPSVRLAARPSPEPPPPPTREEIVSRRLREILQGEKLGSADDWPILLELAQEQLVREGLLSDRVPLPQATVQALYEQIVSSADSSAGMEEGLDGALKRQTLSLLNKVLSGPQTTEITAVHLRRLQALFEKASQEQKRIFLRDLFRIYGPSLERLARRRLAEAPVLPPAAVDAKPSIVVVGPAVNLNLNIGWKPSQTSPGTLEIDLAGTSLKADGSPTNVMEALQRLRRAYRSIGVQSQGQQPVDEIFFALLQATGILPTGWPVNSTDIDFAPTMTAGSLNLDVRFLPPEPSWKPSELEAYAATVRRAIEEVAQADRKGVLVWTSRVPANAPPAYLSDLFRAGKEQGLFVVYDPKVTTLRDPALLQALREAGPHLVAPDLEEFSALAGRPVARAPAEVVRAARELLAESDLQMILISLDEDGALLVDRTRVAYANVEPKVSVLGPGGAGDVGLANLVHLYTQAERIGGSFSELTDQDFVELLRAYVAGGAAAVQMPGDESPPADLIREMERRAHTKLFKNPPQETLSRFGSFRELRARTDAPYRDQVWVPRLERFFYSDPVVPSADNAGSDLYLDFILSHPQRFKDKDILDPVTGSGVLAAALAVAGARRVVATDISPEAVRLAEANLREIPESRDRVTIGVSDVYGSLPSITDIGQFDLIVANSPTGRWNPVPGQSGTYETSAGEEFEVPRKLVSGLDRWMKPGGEGLYMTTRGVPEEDPPRRLTVGYLKRFLPLGWFVEPTGFEAMGRSEEIALMIQHVQRQEQGERPAGMEEDPMLPARETGYGSESNLNRTFGALNRWYQGTLGQTIEGLLPPEGGPPLPVLFVGLGRGNEALGAKRRFGDRIEVWAINRKRGEFYDSEHYFKERPFGEPQRTKELQILRSVQRNLRIVDLEDEAVSLEEVFGGQRFAVVVFGNSVGFYMQDKIRVFNRLLRELVSPNGYLLVFTSNLYVDGSGPDRFFSRLSQENPEVVQEVGIHGLRLRNDGAFQIPLSFVRPEPAGAGGYRSYYRVAPTTPTAGMEEKPNINALNAAQIEIHLGTLPPLQVVPAPARQELAQEIFRRRPPQGYRNRQDFLQRVGDLAGKIEHLSQERIQAVANSASFGRRGLSRRTMVKIGLGLLAGGVLGGGYSLYRWVTAPSGRVIGVFHYHAGPEDFDPVLDQLRHLEGQPNLVYMPEHSPPPLAHLELVRPELARQITSLESLDNPNIRRQLEALFRDHQNIYEETVAELRARPGRLQDPQVREVLETVFPVYEYLTLHPGITVVSERAPFESFLNMLRGDLALRQAARALFRDRDEEAYFLAMAAYYRYQERSDEQRDQAYVRQIQQVLDRNPRATIVIQRGSAHFGAPGLSGDYGGHRVQTEVHQPDQVLLPYGAALLPHRERLLSDERSTIPPAARPALLRYYPWFSLFAAFSQEIKRGEQAAAEATAFLQTLSDQDMARLLGELQRRDDAFRRHAQGDYSRWFDWMARYTIAWLNTNGKIPPAVRQKLPPALRDLRVEQLEPLLLDRQGQGQKLPALPQGPLVRIDGVAPGLALLHLGAGMEEPSAADLVGAARAFLIDALEPLYEGLGRDEQERFELIQPTAWENGLWLPEPLVTVLQRLRASETAFAAGDSETGLTLLRSGVGFLQQIWEGVPVETNVQRLQSLRNEVGPLLQPLKGLEWELTLRSLPGLVRLNQVDLVENSQKRHPFHPYGPLDREAALDLIRSIEEWYALYSRRVSKRDAQVPRFLYHLTEQPDQPPQEWRLVSMLKADAAAGRVQQDAFEAAPGQELVVTIQKEIETAQPIFQLLAWYQTGPQAESTAGMEEQKPNVNRMDETRLADYLEGLPALKKLEASIRREMALAILRERLHGGPFKRSSDQTAREGFARRMYGKVTGVKNPVWDEVSRALRYGISRRTFLGVMGASVAGGLAAVGGVTALLLDQDRVSPAPGKGPAAGSLEPEVQAFIDMLATNPGEGGVLVRLQSHEGKADAESALGWILRMADALGPDRILVVGERAAPTIKNLERITEREFDRARWFPEAKLSQRIRDYYVGGGKPPITLPSLFGDAEVQKVWEDLYRTAAPIWEELLQEYLKRALSDSSDEGFRAVLSRGLSERKIGQVWEKPPLASWLIGELADRARGGHMVELFENGDEEAYFRAVADELDFRYWEAAERDQTLSEQMEQWAKEYPRHLIIVVRGTNHEALASFLSGRGIRHAVSQEASLSPESADAIARIRAGRSGLPFDVAERRAFRKLMVAYRLAFLLEGALLSRGWGSREAGPIVKAVMDQISDKQIQTLNRAVFEQGLRVRQAIGDLNPERFGYYDRFIYAWLNGEGLISAQFRALVGPEIRDLKLEDWERSIERVRRGGLEEVVLEEWQGMRSQAERLTPVVLSARLATEYPVLEQITRMEPYILIDQGVETIPALIALDARFAYYYGEQMEARRFAAIAAEALITIEQRPPVTETLLEHLEEVLSLVGITKGSLAVGLEEFAAGLEQLEKAA